MSNLASEVGQSNLRNDATISSAGGGTRREKRALAGAWRKGVTGGRDGRRHRGGPPRGGWGKAPYGQAGAIHAGWPGTRP